ncbi:uncharacterized protein NECHADRAFT_82573 [Fusarium vanettenii 77-13-4]|uniref:Uncharacterized protein n=1 Tax=Fusarium vanettenii (strain ATCC MYA-4622 / CBS 123669 / FGSC 9596 / NRRL 45880 / 77-13-4) TaxID=660122 RepID=C7YXL5_FUSV7|nr:uncharacterized protein NECHADRAFT_82573 [Fusarium vanettenii 77-13-4]EEU43606.1 predicted protein [Fusarium vanettenii 77-13-4]
MADETPTPTKMQQSLTSEEICQALDSDDAARRALADAQSRSIYRETKQWPREWVGDFPPSRWTAHMVHNLARVIRHVARGASGSASLENKPTLEDLQNYIRRRAKGGRSHHAQLKPGDITDAMDYFGVARSKNESAAVENQLASRGSGRVALEDEDDQKGEGEDKKDVINSTTEERQDERDGDTKHESDEVNNNQTRTSSKATASPFPVLNSPDRVSIHQKLARQAYSSPLQKTTTHDHPAPSSSVSPKKHARSEDTSPSPAIATSGEPAKRRRLYANKPIADPDLSPPTADDSASTMTKEKDWETLHVVVKRRQTESSLEYMTLKKKVDTLRDELQTRKMSLETGKFVWTPSRGELLIHKNTRDDVLTNLQKLRRTVEYYLTNKDLLETLDLETRALVTKGHERRLGDMEKELAKAETHVQDARRKVEAESEEVKQRIEEDEVRLGDMETGLDLAHTEHDRWRCMGHLAALTARDLERVMTCLEKRGLGPSEYPEKQMREAEDDATVQGKIEGLGNGSERMRGYWEWMSSMVELMF